MAIIQPSDPPMTLIAATIEDYDAPPLLRELVARGWGATQIAATGNALRGGRLTVLIGVPATQTRSVLRLIEEHCRPSVEAQPAELDVHDESWHPTSAVMGGASVLVLPVVRFVRL